MYALNGLGVASASDLGAFWNRKRRRVAHRPIAKKIVGRGHPKLLKLEFRRPAAQPDPRMTPKQRAAWDRMTPKQQAALARLQRSWDEARAREEQASTSGLGDATTMVGGVLAVGAVAAAAYFLFGKQLGLKKNRSTARRRRSRSSRPVSAMADYNPTPAQEASYKAYYMAEEAWDRASAGGTRRAPQETKAVDKAWRSMLALHPSAKYASRQYHSWRLRNHKF